MVKFLVGSCEQRPMLRNGTVLRSSAVTIGTTRQHNLTLWYQFCNFKHFLKAENSEDSLASSCVEISICLSCNPV